MESAKTTRAQLARDTGVSERGIAAILDRGTSPLALNLVKIASALDVPVGWLCPSPQSLDAETVRFHREARQEFDTARDQRAAERKASLQRGLEILGDLEDLEETESITGEGTTEVPIVGYIGAGESIIAYDDFAHGDGMEHVEVPGAMHPNTVGARLKGLSQLGVLNDGAIIFWSTRRHDVDEFVGNLVVCHLADGRKLVKTLAYGTAPGFFNLLSTNMGPLIDQVVESVSPIDWIRMR